MENKEVKVCANADCGRLYPPTAEDEGFCRDCEREFWERVQRAKERRLAREAAAKEKP